MNINARKKTLLFILLTCISALSCGPEKPPAIPGRPIADILKEGIPKDIEEKVLARYSPQAKVVIKYLKPSSNGDGSSWSSAESNLKNVINSINDASANKIYLLLLAAGEYKTGDTISMKNNVAIIGGFLGDSAYNLARSGDNTTLDGNNKYKVISNKNLDPSALLYRIQISHGKSENNGGGMVNVNSSPTLINVSFVGNSAAIGGGGMANITNSSPTLTNVSFANNSAGIGGGGIANIVNSSPTLTNVSFANNSAGQTGGAMFNNASSPTLTNVSFADNSANQSGGAIFNNVSSPTLINVSFAVNSTANGSGGAIFNKQSSPILANISFANNSADKGYGEALFNDQSSPFVVNCIFWNNIAGAPTSTSHAQIFTTKSTLRIYHSVLQGGRGGIDGDTTGKILAYEGMVETDPIFSPIKNNGGFVPTIAIDTNSSAINKGLYAKRDASTTPAKFYFSADNTSWFTIDANGNKVADTPPAGAEDLTATDARGYKRIQVPDAGAYEAKAAL